MKQLFEKTKINQMELKNRFVRSATWEGLANSDGSCSEELTDLVVNLAKGQVGLIINSATYVDPTGQANIRQLGIYNDHLISSYKEMVQKVHKEGSKIIMQIVHTGCLASNKFVKSKTMGPSSIKIKDFDCREMAKKEIFGAIEDFKKAAVRANKAGFDGVQLHAAHGYFLSQFLSPFFNKRKDDYGGSLEKRARFILEILQAIRSELGRQFTITIKLNSDDFIKGGLTPSEMVEASALLEKGGIDAIEISGGTELGKYTGARITKDILQEDEVYYRDAAKLYKEKITVPLILVGGIRSYEVAKELIEKELADYIALSRPLIREPGLIKRWQSGDTKKATCVSCNRCFEPIRAREGMHCIYEKRNKE